VRRAKFAPSGLFAIALNAFGEEFDCKQETKPMAAFGEEFDVKGPLFPLERQGVVGVVGIQGPLLEHPNADFDDYDSIENRARMVFEDTDTQVLALRINSPGGAAAGCIELARALRKMSDETRKPIATIVDGMAASAAWAIACAATIGISAPPTSTVGSMAVYKTQVDQTALDRAMGLRFEFIASDGADLKLAGNPHIAMTEAVREFEREKVNLMTDLFYGLVEEMRGISRAQSAALRGAALLASQGAEKGLVDSLKTYGAFIQELQTPQGRKLHTMPPKTSTAAQAKASDKEWEALRTLAESDDETKRNMARKMLKTMMGEEEPSEPAADPQKKKDDEAKAEEDKKKEEEAKAAKAKEEEAKAQALAQQGAVAMAKELQEVRAISAETQAKLDAALKEAADAKALAATEAKRSELLAQRADFSAAQRATLAKVPLEIVEDAVKNWPRVHANPRAAVNATVTPITRGKASPVAVAMTDEQERALAVVRGSKPAGAGVESVGNEMTLGIVDPAAAEARLKELDEIAKAQAG
jgi:ClpP class serine protease